MLDKLNFYINLKKEVITKMKKEVQEVSLNEKIKEVAEKFIKITEKKEILVVSHFDSGVKKAGQKILLENS